MDKKAPAGDLTTAGGSVYNDLDGILAVLAAPSSRSVAKLTAKGELLHSSMISALIF